MQVAAGLMCILFGMIHFVDRTRPNRERHAYFLGDPASEAGRAMLATLEVGMGFLLLFTA